MALMMVFKFSLPGLKDLLNDLLIGGANGLA